MQTAPWDFLNQMKLAGPAQNSLFSGAAKKFLQIGDRP